MSSCNNDRPDCDKAETRLYGDLSAQITPLEQAYSPSKDASDLEYCVPSATQAFSCERAMVLASRSVMPQPDPTIAQNTALPVISRLRIASRSSRLSQKPSITIRLRLWFYAYRQLFIFVVLFNTVGMILALIDEFPYAQDHPGALVLGNLLFAVLMRNELLLRGLYMLAIYSLRGVRVSLPLDDSG